MKGRECSTHIDCSSFQRTSCVKDLDDKDDKLRCLCGDNKAPVNGLCTAESKGNELIFCKISSLKFVYVHV